MFAVGLQRLLSTLPAEAHALAIDPSLRLYGRIPAGGAPTLYDITTEYVELWADADFDAPGHGWPGPDWRLPIDDATAVAHRVALDLRRQRGRRGRCWHTLHPRLTG